MDDHWDAEAFDHENQVDEFFAPYPGIDVATWLPAGEGGTLTDKEGDLIGMWFDPRCYRVARCLEEL